MEDFDKIYSEYFKNVYGFSLALCQNPTLAEEITQETFFKALKNIDKFKGECNINTWLCKIAKNTFLTLCKKGNRKKEYAFENLISEENIEKKFTDKETAYEIHKILHNMQEPYKEVFSLRAFGELSFSQIGNIFEKSENWARVTYYRAKIIIKERLK